MSPVSAHTVLAALRERAPGLGVKKAHKLLYYVQGHHLAAFGEPLFRERISAWDMGPVVGKVWNEEKSGEVAAKVPAEVAELGEAALNTIGYVLSRYGALTGSDLERLTHHEPPWQRADERRELGASEPIAHEWLEEFFRSAGVEDEDDQPSDGEAVTALLRGAERRLGAPSAPDDPAALRARIERLRGSGTRAG